MNVLTINHKKLLLIHGANLNWLGKRDPVHYGQLSLAAIEALTMTAAQHLHYDVLAYQSNHEGNLIDYLQVHSSNCAGIIINPGAFGHYSYALHDALIDTALPVVEVHLSALNQREPWRQHSVITPLAIRVISGKKEQGYLEAVTVLTDYLANAN